SSTGHAGVNEVRLRHGRIVREGLRTTLTELRLRKTARTARERGIPSADIRLCSLWGEIAGNSATSGNMRTGSRDAGDIKGASLIQTRVARSTWAKTVKGYCQLISRRPS